MDEYRQRCLFRLVGEEASFFRVTKVIEKSNSYFFGFAVQVIAENHCPPKTVFFSTNQRKSCLYVGPVKIFDEEDATTNATNHSEDYETDSMVTEHSKRGINRCPISLNRNTIP